MGNIEYDGNNIITYTFITKADIVAQYGTVSNLANLNVTGADAVVNWIAGFIKATKYLAPLNDVIIAATVERAILSSFLTQCQAYGDFCIVAITTYSFDGWGTGNPNAIPGYATYKVSNVHYELEC